MDDKVMTAQVIVIGGGPGGYVAAIRLAQLGAKVMLVEKNKLGGTCLNRGCIPTKALLQSIELLDEIQKSSQMGIECGNVRADIPSIEQRKKKVVDQLVSGVGYLLKARNVDVVYGEAQFLTDRKIQITALDESISYATAGTFVIASGSVPATLPILGIDGKGVISSNEALELGEIPESMLIIGGGIIGVELGSIYAGLGTRITIIESLQRILPNIDGEVVKELEKSLKKKLTIHTGSKVLAIKDENEKKSVSVQTADGATTDFLVDQVLVAVGRAPCISGLNLDNIGVRTANTGIVVNEYFQTSVKNIYAIGDAIGGIQLAHVASGQGMTAAEQIMGKKSEINLEIIPACIYTKPEIASIGLTEEQAKEQGIICKVGRFPFRANGKALTIGQTEGFVKILSDEQYGEVVGAHIIGPHATDMIGEFAVAMKLGATIDEIAATIHAHPTLSEAIMEAAHACIGEAIHWR